jgi:branched-chain amino acid transport system ATP-binding protein
MLELKDVTKYFGGVVANDKITFSVTKGETVGLIGPNGAGKTTLYNLITGLIRTSGGSIIFKGEDITNESPIHIARKGMGRTFQILNLFPNLAVRDNILVGWCCRWKPKFLPLFWKSKRFKEEESSAFERIESILDFTGLKKYESYPAGALPYGYQKRVELARTLATGCDLLLLDEPVAGMNIVETNTMIDLIYKIGEAGITVIVVEHNMRMIMKISKRIIVLDYGKMIADDLPENIRKNRKVTDAYLGTGEVYAAT